MVTEKQETCCSSPGECRVHSILNVDERGQMVLPKDLREKAGIRPGEKLAVVSHEREGEVCCITLIKVEILNGMMKDVLGPVMKDIVA